MNRKMRRTAQSRGKQRHPSSPRADLDYVSAFLDSGWKLLNEGRDQEATELAKRLIRRRETDGTKAFLLKVMNPFFRKKPKGEIIPVKISGTYEHPSFGLDVLDDKNSKQAPPH